MKLKTQLVAISVLCIIWIAATILYIVYLTPEFTGEKETEAALKTLLESVSALGVISTILFSAFTSVEASNSRRDQTKALEATLKQSKLERSVDYCRRWNDERFGLARDLIRLYYLNTNQSNQKLFAESLEASPEKHRSFISVLGFFGEISDSIDLDMINEDIVRRAFDNTFTRIYELSLPWARTHVPLLQNDLEKIYFRWRVEVSQFEGELRTRFDTDA